MKWNTYEDAPAVRFWYALYTRPRFEKKVDNSLKESGLQSFLPQRQVLRLWSNYRKKVISEPLFSSYVFVFVDSKELHVARRVRGVARLVSFSGRPTRIPESDIEAVRRILENGYDPEPHQSTAIGDEVEIFTGPLKGITGYLVSIEGQEMFVLSIKNLNQSIAIKIKGDKVRKISYRLTQECKPKPTVLNH